MLRDEYLSFLKPEYINQLLDSDQQYLLELFKIDEEIKKITNKKIGMNKVMKSLEIDIKIIEAHSVSKPDFDQLKNETARNAYRRLASANERRKFNEAEIEIEGYIFQLKQLEMERETQLACIHGIRARLNLTASIFHYLSGKKDDEI